MSNVGGAYSNEVHLVEMGVQQVEYKTKPKIDNKRGVMLANNRGAQRKKQHKKI